MESIKGLIAEALILLVIIVSLLGVYINAQEICKYKGMERIFPVYRMLCLGLVSILFMYLQYLIMR
jgi:hypothetical protein